MTSPKTYDVALSFAGEDRRYAEVLADELKRHGLKVFYDYDEQSSLLGENLYNFLADLYQNKSLYVVPLLSTYYAAKLWTSHELKAAQARAFTEQHAYILPIRLDDTDIPGILQTVGYLTLKNLNDIGIVAEIIFKKIKGVSDSSAALTSSDVKKPRASKAATINTHQVRLEHIYREANKDLDYWYIYGYLCRTIGFLCKKLTKNNAEKEDFIRPLSWLFTLATKVGTDVQDSFLAKYPDCCPHCLGPTCVCFRTGKRPVKDIPAYEVREEVYERYESIINSPRGRTISFTSAIRMIANIFETNQIVWHYSGPAHHIAKTQEEVAEIHEALSLFLSSRKPLKAVSEEIADVLAWLLGAWSIKFPNSSLDNEFIDYFSHGCPVCHRAPCDCKRYGGRPEGLIDVEFLLEVKSRLEKLSKIIPAFGEVLEELIHSIGSAIEDHNQIIARIALAQAAFRLKTIKGNLSGNDDDDSRRATPIIISLLEEMRTHPQKFL